MYDVIIIGCGCAGISAAIYAKRSNMNVLVIECDSPGGQINKSSTIENYPGFESIDGPSLAYNMFNQLYKMNVEYKYGKVVDIKLEKDRKVVITEKDKYNAKNIIIATGRMPRKLNIENEDKFLGKGISYCAICDGSLYKDKDIVIIGGGNSAAEESLYLSEIAKSITILNRSDELRADNNLKNKLEKKDNIKVLYNYKPLKFNEEDNKFSGIEIQNTIDEKKEFIKCDGAFIFIGYEPETSFCKNLNITNENNYIIVNDKMETKIEGIYACGDVILKDLYQIVTSISEGAIAATNVKKHVD